MTKQHRQNLLIWMGLLLVGAAEIAISQIPMPRGARPLLMTPAVLMAVLIGLGYMRLASAPPIARAFAIAGMFWLVVLLSLAMMDPLTRAFYGVIE